MGKKKRQHLEGVCNGALDLSDLTMTRKASFASDSPPEIPAPSANHLTKMSTALSPTGGELQPVPLDADAQEDSHDIKTSALSPDDVSATKRRIIFNLLIQCFGFLLLFTAYQSLQNLQSSINRARNLGLTSLAVIYGTLIPAGPFLAPVAMRYLGLKWTITGSMVTYMIFTIANYWSEFYTVIPASILLGVGAACLWAANGAYLTRLATRYAAVTGQDKAAAISMFFGIFFCIFQTSQVWGNLISSLVLQQGAAEQGAPSAANVSSCGAANCPGGGGGNLVIPPYSLRVTLISIYLACGILAVLLMALFADKEAGKGLFSCLKTCKPCGGGDDLTPTHDGQAGGSEDGEDETSPDCRHLCERFLAAWKFMFREKRMMLLIPLIMYGTMEQGVNVAIFTQAFVGCTLGIHWIGWVMICFGVCDAISALLVGRLRKWIPRQVLFGTAAVLNLALMIEMLTVKPHPSLTVLFFVHAGLWGVADGIWQTQINSLYGVLFPGQQEVAFPMDGFWGAVSYTISFAYGGFLCADVKIGILLALLIVSMATYGVVELMEKRRSKEDGETAGDATEVEKNTTHD
ncbi:protein unc-93 homolog A-like isoform X1 [Branchiostoma floridae x Branchiostoma belcheri]